MINQLFAWFDNVFFFLFHSIDQFISIIFIDCQFLVFLPNKYARFKVDDSQSKRMTNSIVFSPVLYSPSLSSPKLPQPIFLPTRKFGPTINIPDELTECLVTGYNPLDDFAVAPAVFAPPPPLLVRMTSVRPPVAAAPLHFGEKKNEKITLELEIVRKREWNLCKSLKKAIFRAGLLLEKWRKKCLNGYVQLDHGIKSNFYWS